MQTYPVESILNIIRDIVSIPYRILTQCVFSWNGVVVSLWHVAISAMLIGIIISLFVRSGKA